MYYNVYECYYRCGHYGPVQFINLYEDENR